MDRAISENHGSSMMELRSKLPYTEAVLLEIQRLGNVSPTALLHTTTAPTTVGKFNFPVDTHILPHLTSMMMDPEAFPEPRRFNPKRFIDDRGCFAPHHNVVPFGVGKRKCPGENLAKAELFIFFTSLVHKFEIRPAHENDLPTTKYRPGVALAPLPFKARFISRYT